MMGRQVPESQTHQITVPLIPVNSRRKSNLPLHWSIATRKRLGLYEILTFKKSDEEKSLNRDKLK